jgi:hypothetical protein
MITRRVRVLLNRLALPRTRTSTSTRALRLSVPNQPIPLPGRRHRRRDTPRGGLWRKCEPR